MASYLLITGSGVGTFAIEVADSPPPPGPASLIDFDAEAGALLGQASPSGAALFDGGSSLRASSSLADSVRMITAWARPAAGAAGVSGVFGVEGLPVGDYLYRDDTAKTIIAASDARPGGVYASRSVSVAVADDELAFIGASFDGGAVKVSKNGAAYGAADASAIGARAAMSHVAVGGWGVPPDEDHFVGTLDATALWSRELTEIELAWLYNGGAGRSYAELTLELRLALLGWWGLGEASGPRMDSHGALDLEPTGTDADPDAEPTAVAGVMDDARGGRRAWDGAAVDTCGDFAAADASSRPMARSHRRVGHYGRLEQATADAGMRMTGEGVGGKASYALGAALEGVVIGTTGAFIYHHESGADGTVTAHGLDADGFPFLRVTGPAGADPATRTCGVPAFDRFGVLGGGTEDDPEGLSRTRCILHLDRLGDLAISDRVVVAGCGTPHDGTFPITECHYETATSSYRVVYLADTPYSGSSITPTLGTVTPTGEIQKPWLPGGDPNDTAWPSYEPRRLPLIVVRDDLADEIRWYLKDDLLWSEPLAGLPIGASGDVTITVGGPGDGVDDGPAYLPAVLRGVEGVPDADALRSLAVRLCCTADGAVAMAHHPVAVDFECLPGVARRQQAKVGAIVGAWIDDATDSVIAGDPDDRTGDTPGQFRSDFSMTCLGEFDQTTTTTYTLAFAYASPRWDDEGNPVASSWQYAGTPIAAARVPYRDDRRFHVSGSGDDSDPGTEAAPKRTIGSALAMVVPETLVIVGRDAVYANVVAPAGVGPYCVAGAPGAGALPNVVQPVIEDFPEVGTDWAGNCVELSSGLGDATFVDLNLDMRHSATATTGNNTAARGGGVGYAFDRCDSNAPGGGYLLYWVAPELFHFARSSAPGGGERLYGIYLGDAGGRRISLRGVHLDRPADPGGSHIMRSGGLDTIHMAGVSYRPAIAPTYGGSVDWSLRNNTRRATLDRCDFGDVVVAHSSGNTTQIPGMTIGSRCRWTECVMGQGWFQGTSHSYVGGCVSRSAGFNTEDGQDSGMGHSYCNVWEGDAWVGSSALTGEQGAHPTASGAYRNTMPATLATGESLAAPPVLAVEVPGIGAAVMADGYAQGGTLPRSLTLVANSTEVPGSGASGAIVALAPGAHTLRSSASDDGGLGDASGSELIFDVEG